MPDTVEYDLAAAVAVLRQLPLRVRLGEFETAHSLLSRLAIRNGYDGANALISHVPGLRPRSRYSVEATVAIAATLNGVDAEVLARSSPIRIGATTAFEGHVVLSGQGPIQGRVCVSCLIQDLEERGGPQECRAYSRDWWQVGQITSCPTHRVLLIGICPRCKSWLNGRRPHTQFCPCGFNLVKASVRPMSREAVLADAYLLGRLNRSRSEDAPLLDTLPFVLAGEVMLHLGASIESDIKLPRSWNPKDDRAQLMSRGLSVLQEGWHSFDDALSLIIERSRKGLTVFGNYGRLQRWLTEETAAELEPFRSRIETHARAHKGVAPKSKLFRRRILNARWTTMFVAKKRIGRAASAIYRMAVTLGLEDEVTSQERNAFITTSAVELIAKKFELSVPAAVVRERLGVSHKQLRSYVSAGYLREVLPASANHTTFYDRSELEQIVDRIVGNAEELAKPTPDLVSLSEGDQILREGSGETMAALVEGALQAAAVMVGRDQIRRPSMALLRRADVVRLKMMRNPTLTALQAKEALRLKCGEAHKLGPVLRHDVGSRESSGERLGRAPTKAR